MAWQADLDCVVAAIRSEHPDPFFGISEEEFDAAADRVRLEIPVLSDYEILLDFAALTAMISRSGRDGHTHLSMSGGSVPWPQTFYPLRLYAFDDGIFVIDALAPHEDLIGSQVLAIGGVPIDRVVDALSRVVSGDNNQDRRARIPVLLPWAEVLRAAGLTSGVEAADWMLQKPGAEPTPVQITPVAGSQYWPLFTATPRQMIPAPGEPPLYLSRLGEDFWFHLEDDQTLYVQYNAASGQTQSGDTVDAFADAIDAVVATESPEQVIIDLRHNTGGDNTTYEPLLRVLESRAIDQPKKLFAIIGRHTWSAGVNFATDLERRTEAVFVGEPSGGSPNQYGDAEPLTLPNSRLVLFISTRYHQRSEVDDDRLSIQPDVAAPPSAVTYFANRDPALEAILGQADPPG